MTESAQTTGTLEAKALESIANHRAKPEGQTGLTADQYVVGEVVAVYSRGTWRNAIVEKVGPKRVNVVYTTEGAVATSIEHYDRYQALDINAAAVRDGVTDGRNYDYYAAVVSGEKRNAYTTEAEVTRYASYIEGQTREQYVANGVARSFSNYERERSVGRLDRVNYTRKSVPAGEVVKRS